MRKAWKPHSSRPILIYFEFRSKPSLIAVNCMDPHSPHKLFATKYCFLIPGDDTSFFFFNFFLFRFFVILRYHQFLQKLFYYYYYYLLIYLFSLLFFFMKIIFIFSCSGMFRDVPECSVFPVLSTPYHQALWSADGPNTKLRSTSMNVEGSDDFYSLRFNIIRFKYFNSCLFCLLFLEKKKIKKEKKNR